MDVQNLKLLRESAQAKGHYAQVASLDRKIKDLEPAPRAKKAPAKKVPAKKTAKKAATKAKKAAKTVAKKTTKTAKKAAKKR